ncbi:hypothetical protein [Mesobacillus maritimus]|uniref:Uncharacterized protein n=1 Tax=Mesobacillus maritimus TaxID=1643336 RepID=A0ABS7K093_9BACI|nr:hypothetical protein [Mesobacillus maritimus]MBY0095679.1 hypothetical protein [Mesobacillus maritimus]
MEIPLVTEWLKMRKLTENEIDFLLTFIPTITYLQKSPDKKTEVFKMFNEQFPTFFVEPELNYFEYELLDSAIQRNTSNKISTKELLERMSEQGLCKPFCDSLLNNQKLK